VVRNNISKIHWSVRFLSKRIRLQLIHFQTCWKITLFGSSATQHFLFFNWAVEFHLVQIISWIFECEFPWSLDRMRVTNCEASWFSRVHALECLSSELCERPGVEPNTEYDILTQSTGHCSNWKCYKTYYSASGRIRTVGAMYAELKVVFIVKCIAFNYSSTCTNMLFPLLNKILRNISLISVLFLSYKCIKSRH
jgi:hypothetical protein